MLRNCVCDLKTLMSIKSPALSLSSHAQVSWFPVAHISSFALASGPDLASSSSLKLPPHPPFSYGLMSFRNGSRAGWVASTAVPDNKPWSLGQLKSSIVDPSGSQN